MTLEQQIKQKTDFINEAMTLSLQGAEVDLGSLDTDVEQLCIQATELPQGEESKACRAALEEMISALDNLATALRTLQEN